MNTVVGFDSGGGIYNAGILTLNSSTVANNQGFNGIDTENGTTTLNNSTVSGHQGSGIFQTFSHIFINNSTISGNTNGIDTEQGYELELTIQNSVVAGNTHDCIGVMTSAGYNLIGNKSGCQFTLKTGDITNVDAKVGQLIGYPGYIPLLLGSPAINAGNPATCLPTDERGMVRPQGSRCDMGSYEYKTPGPAASMGYAIGSNQTGEAGGVFAKPFTVYVVDSVGSPVQNIPFTFTAPLNAMSGTFTDTHTHTTTKATNSSGVASAAPFTASNTPGSYTVVAQTSTFPNSPISFLLTNLPVPAPLSPVGLIATLKPTYTWGKVIGATQYNYQILVDGTPEYSSIVPASACGTTTCSYTPNYLLHLPSLSNAWRVRAMRGGVWQNYSGYKSFSVDIKTGLWSGTGVKFYVSPTRTVEKFTVYVRVKGCGNYAIMYKYPLPIDDINNFSFFSHTFSIYGHFSDPTHAYGSFGFRKFYIQGCGYIPDRDYGWTAVWKNATQPTAVIDKALTPILVEPLSSIPTDDGSYTVERVSR